MALLGSLLALATGTPAAAVPTPTPIGVDNVCNDAEIAMRERAVLATAVAKRIDAMHGIVELNNDDIAAAVEAELEAAPSGSGEPAAIESQLAIDGDAAEDAISQALTEALAEVDVAEDILEQQLALPQDLWQSCDEQHAAAQAGIDALSALFAEARGDLDVSTDLTAAVQQREGDDAASDAASDPANTAATRGEAAQPEPTKPETIKPEPSRPEVSPPPPTDPVPVKPAGGGGGSLVVNNYCMAIDQNLRTGIRSHDGGPTEPATITQPSDGAFVALDGNVPTYAGQAETWENAEGDNLRVVGHLADDRSAPVDLMSIFPMVYVKAGPFVIDVLSPEPLCYADELGAGTDDPMIGYIDTRELAELPPPAIAPGLNATYSPLGEVDARSAVAIEVHVTEGSQLGMSIQSDRHMMFIGDEPYAVGEEVPADLGARIDDSLLQFAEDWLDDELTDLAADLDSTLTALNRVEYVTVNNVDVDISVTSPIPGDGDETELRLAASINDIHIRIKKANGNESECGDVHIGPISGEVRLRLDLAPDGQSIQPVVTNTPVLDLGNIDVNQTQGFWGCAGAMTKGVKDIRGSIESFFNLTLPSGSGCGFGTWLVAGLSVIVGVVVAIAVPGGQGLGIGLAAAGLNGLSDCFQASLPSGLSWLDVFVDAITGDVDFNLDLGTFDLNGVLDPIIDSIAQFSIAEAISDSPALGDASMTLVDSCWPYGCDGGDVAITPSGIEFLADLNLQLHAPNAGGGGASSTHTFNHPDQLPAWLTGYTDGLTVADVVELDSPLGGGTSDLAVVVGYDSLNAALAQLTADGVLDSTHGADNACTEVAGDVIDNSFSTDTFDLTYNVRTTVPPILVGLPYTNSGTGESLPTVLGLRNIVVDLYDTATDSLLVSVFVDINGGFGLDHDLGVGELTPVIDVDPASLLVTYRDTESSHLFAPVIVDQVEAALVDEVDAILDGLVTSECGLRPIDIDGGISSLVDAQGEQIVDVDFDIWMQPFSNGIAIYADVIPPLDVTIQVLSVDTETGYIEVRANPNLGPPDQFDYRWQVRTEQFFPNAGSAIAQPWTAWTQGDRERTFWVPLPAPHPALNQDLLGFIDVEVRDSYGREAEATRLQWFFVECYDPDNPFGMCFG